MSPTVIGSSDAVSDWRPREASRTRAATFSFAVRDASEPARRRSSRLPRLPPTADPIGPPSAPLFLPPPVSLASRSHPRPQSSRPVGCFAIENLETSDELHNTPSTSVVGLPADGASVARCWGRDLTADHFARSQLEGTRRHVERVPALALASREADGWSVARGGLLGSPRSRPLWRAGSNVDGGLPRFGHQPTPAAWSTEPGERCPQPASRIGAS